MTELNHDTRSVLSVIKAAQLIVSKLLLPLPILLWCTVQTAGGGAHDLWQQLPCVTRRTRLTWHGVSVEHRLVWTPQIYLVKISRWPLSCYNNRHARQPSRLNPCSTITHILYHTLKCVNYNYEPYFSILHIIIYVWKMFYQLNHFIVI